MWVSITSVTHITSGNVSNNGNVDNSGNAGFAVLLYVCIC